MFEVDALIDECRRAMADGEPRRAVREVLERTVSDPGPVADVLGSDTGGLSVLYRSDDLTVLNVIWPPGMSL
ncbi:MAG: hypothetical protein ACYDH6_04690 [Acidimicrobiales bacterium]